jgi:hypothetical protein
VPRADIALHPDLVAQMRGDAPVPYPHDIQFRQPAPRHLPILSQRNLATERNPASDRAVMPRMVRSEDGC